MKSPVVKSSRVRGWLQSIFDGISLFGMPTRAKDNDDFPKNSDSSKQILMGDAMTNCQFTCRRAERKLVQLDHISYATYSYVGRGHAPEQQEHGVRLITN